MTAVQGMLIKALEQIMNNGALVTFMLLVMAGLIWHSHEQSKGYGAAMAEVKNEVLTLRTDLVKCSEQREALSIRVAVLEYQAAKKR